MEKSPRTSESGSSLSSITQTKILDAKQQELSQSGSQDGSNQDDSSYGVTGPKLAIIVAAVAMACFLTLVDTMVMSTAIPRITDEFNSLVDVGWYASAYQFASAAPQPLTGKVYMHLSTKWSFLFFFGIFELGSLLCGAASSSDMLIVGRAVAGLGAAGIINGAIMIISGCVPLAKRPGFIGATVGFGQLGLIVGPLIGGAFTTYSTWRWCFYINLPIGAVMAATIVFLHIPEQTPKQRALTVLPKLHKHLDLLGFVLFAPAVLQLLLALQYGGNQYAWNSSRVIGLFCGAGVNLIVWLLWNYHKGDDALIPYSMVRRTTIWAGGLFQSFFMAALYGTVYFLPIYFQAINNASAMMSGVYLLPTIVPQIFMSGAAGVLVMKIGRIIPLALISVVLLSMSSGLYSLLQPGSPIGWWVGFQIMAGVGSGLGLNLAIMAVQAAVTGEELSSAMSFIVFAQSLGPAVFLSLCDVIFNASLKPQLAQHAPSVDTAAVIKAGATGFRKIVQPGDVASILLAYANSVDRVFYLIAAIAAVCGVFVWGLGWQDLRVKSKTEQEEGHESA